MTAHWPFDQPRNVAALTTQLVMHEGAPVLQVIHYSDDHSWAFLDSGSFDASNALVVSMGSVVDIDSSLLVVADLPPGWIAERGSAGENWIRRQDSDV